jgi:hypothetical protein
VAEIPGLKVNLLSVSVLEDMGYAITFEDGHVLIHLEGADTQDAVARLGIIEVMMHRVLGQPIVGSKGILDRRSDQSAATAAANLMGSEIDPEEGSSKGTFLTKRKC